MTLSLRRWRVVLGLVLATTMTLALWHVATATADTLTENYTAPGTYTVTIPQYTTSFPILAAGGSGTDGGGGGIASTAGAGGYGSLVDETVTPNEFVHPGDTLKIIVGAKGGGGQGGSGNEQGAAGGNGGGASQVIDTSTDTTLTIAGGGGGGGGIAAPAFTSSGGNGNHRPDASDRGQSGSGTNNSGRRGRFVGRQPPDRVPGRRQRQCAAGIIHLRHSTQLDGPSAVTLDGQGNCSWPTPTVAR